MNDSAKLYLEHLCMICGFGWFIIFSTKLTIFSHFFSEIISCIISNGTHCKHLNEMLSMSTSYLLKSVCGEMIQNSDFSTFNHIFLENICCDACWMGSSWTLLPISTFCFDCFV